MPTFMLFQQKYEKNARSILLINKPIVIVADDQSINTPAYLLTFLLETVSVAARLVSKTGYPSF